MKTSIKLANGLKLANSMNLAGIKLDSYDRAILKELDSDARQPLSTLSRKVHLSRDAIRNRINRLLKARIIRGFRPDYALEGNVSYLFLSLQDPFDEKKFLQHLEPAKKVINISRLMGKWDYLLQIVAQEPAETDRILKELRKKFPIKEQEVYTVLKEHKKEVRGIENFYK